MSVFRRRRRAEEPAGEGAPEDGFVDDLDEQERAREDAELLAGLEDAGPPPRPQGPWDVADAPDDGVQRLDLGGLRVPVPAQTEVRIEVSEEGEVMAATLVRGDSSVQVNAFAAPRTAPIWPEVRAEITETLTGGGGSAEDREGPYGVELAAAVPTQLPDSRIVLQPARFVGVDGPRWFLRALFTGPAAVDPEAAAPLEAAVRDVVVVRGADAMAVRDQLPLRLPPQAQQAVDEQGLDEQGLDGQVPGEQGPGEQGPGGRVPGEQVPGERDLSMPERGPEITETR